MPVVQSGVNAPYSKFCDVQLTSLKMSNFDRSQTIDLTSNFVSLKFFEDIFNPSMHGTLDIYDTIGLMSGKFSKFPIIGEEWITIEYFVPMKSKLSMTFHAYGISGAKHDSKQSSQIFTIHLISEEAMLSHGMRIQRAYSDFFTNVVSDICKKYLTMNSKKPVNTSTTDGIQNVIIPNLRPFDAIKFIANRSVSSDYPTNSFIFFENVDGYYFTTIEELFAKGNLAGKNQTNSNYTYNYGVISNSIGMPFDSIKNAITMEIKNAPNGLKKLTLK